MPTLTAAGRAGCLSFCPGWPRMNIQPRAKHVMCHATLTLGGLRTLEYSLPRTRVLHMHTAHTASRRRAQKVVLFFAVLQLWRCGEKTRRMDGRKRHPTHPRALPGNNVGGCNGARPTLLGACQGAWRKSSGSPLCISVSAETSVGVSLERPN